MKTPTEKLLDRNVDKIYPSKEALALALASGKKLTLYLGIDPSSSRIHLGNAIALWKMREFADLGHHVILLIGDFTGMIGDPTDKAAARQPLTSEQVLENAKTYKEQASKILPFEGENKVEIKYNSQWLAKFNFADLIKLAANFTVQQFIERDMFQKRLQENKPISLHEFFYPLMQGYDSVAMNVDLEIGGRDQTFNMLIGRDLVSKLQNREKFVLTLPLLEGTDGRKMSKTFTNSIDITDEPSSMFGKVMSLRDDLITKYFAMTTQVDEKKLAEIENRLKKENPIEVKKELARELVTLYHSAGAAQEAQAEFEKVVQNKEMPTVIEEVEYKRSDFKAPVTYASVAAATGMVASSSEAVRLAQQGGLLFNNVKIDSAREPFDLNSVGEVTIQAGKRRFKKVKFL